MGLFSKDKIRKNNHHKENDKNVVNRGIQTGNPSSKVIYFTKYVPLEDQTQYAVLLHQPCFSDKEQELSLSKFNQKFTKRNTFERLLCNIEILVGTEVERCWSIVIHLKYRERFPVIRDLET